jgi:serine/threonine protein kinase/tetratricopeptide (TPR) repeat protein
MICPDDSILESFLDEALPEADRRAVAEHVDHCEACQRRLDHLGPSDEDSPANGKTDLLEPADRATVAALIQRLQSETLLSAEFAERLQTDSQSLADSNLSLPAALDHYRLIELVGEGATGRLYRAHDERLDRIVAVKILKPELATIPYARSRFAREARAYAALRHDHIVNVHRVEASDASRPTYLVMEFVEGGTLQDRLKSDISASLPTVVEWIRQAAVALQAAHDAGIIHRDIKPSNLLIDDSTGRLRVTDFGLARLTDAEESLTAEDAIAGTPAYMSPEQIAHPKEVSGLSDVYSLGVVLYEILTGERPFRGNVRMVLNQVQHEEPVPPRRLNDRIPRDLETVCLKAIAKEPKSRYASAQTFADDLQRWLEGRTVIARPVGTFQRAWRWSRRNPRLAGAGAIVAAVLTAGAIDWGQLRSSSVENRLRQQWSSDVANRDKLISTIAARAQTAESGWLLSLETVKSLVSARGPNTRPASERISPESIRRLQSLSEKILSHSKPTPATVIAAREVGDIWMQLDRHSQADELFRLAATQAATLLADNPEDSDVRLALTGVLIRRANLKLESGEPGESFHLLTSAETTISEPLAPKTPQAVFDRATIQHRLGDVEYRQENLEAAADRYNRSLKELAALATTSDAAATLNQRSMVTLKLASVLNRNDGEQAHAVCVQACQLNLDALAEGDKGALFRAAESYHELASCLTRLDRLKEAIDAATKQSEILNQLAEIKPAPVSSHEAGASWLRLATLFTQLEQWPASADAADHAIKLIRPTAESATSKVADQLSLAEAELLLVTARIFSGSDDVNSEFFRSVERRIQSAHAEAERSAPQLKARAAMLLTRCRELIEASSPKR